MCKCIVNTKCWTLNVKHRAEHYYTLIQCLDFIQYVMWIHIRINTISVRTHYRTHIKQYYPLFPVINISHIHFVRQLLYKYILNRPSIILILQFRWALDLFYDCILTLPIFFIETWKMKTHVLCKNNMRNFVNATT